MEAIDDTLFARIHALAAGFLEGTLAPAQRSELETLLLTSTAARNIYLQYVQETACLRWLCTEEFPNVVELSKPIEVNSSRGKSRRRRIAAGFFGGGLACLVAIGIAAWWNADRSP